MVCTHGVPVRTKQQREQIPEDSRPALDFQYDTLDTPYRTHAISTDIMNWSY